MTPVLLLALTLGADPWVTGPKFAAEWDRPLTATFENSELRETLRKLGPDRQLAVILDRRIDPNQTVALSMQQESLWKGVARLAEDHGAELVLTDHVAYLGHPDRARWLRTAIVHGERSMATEANKRLVPTRKTISWDDLATSRSILDHLGNVFQWKWDNPELVPHDLWAGATLPDVTPAEALTLVLIQFDLSWTWQPKGRHVTIVPWLTPELLEGGYSPRGKMTLARALEEGPSRWPEVTFAAREKNVLVRGRVEELEQIQKWLTGSLNRVGPSDGPPPTPLSQRRFTLSEKNVSARAVLKELEKSGAVIVLDEDSLAAAKVDLDRMVSVQVMKAMIGEFLRAVLGPINAVADVDGLTITVRGKE